MKEYVDKLKKEYPHIEYIENGDGKIDESFLSLIEELNKAGIKTTECCCGHNIRPAYVVISMENVCEVTIKNKELLILRWSPELIENKGGLM